MRRLRPGGPPLLPRPRSALSALPALPALLLVLALLAGCGGGVGGTGTGPAAVQPPPSATPGLDPLLCDSALQPLLRCPATGSVSASQGTALVWLADDAVAQRSLARLKGLTLELELGCAGWRFDGLWNPGATPETALRYVGELKPLGGGNPQPGSVVLQPIAEGVLLQLLDASGMAIGPAQTLGAVPAPPPPAACES